jgi:glycosyltransferase involved in cell wall biosynthesis
MPKVSVVIPTNNRAPFLKAAIQSVLNQTFQDFEIIVVDDASRDPTPEVVRSFSDARIQYIRHETAKGQGVTRNDGINQASGEYIALLDDDDEWLPQKLRKQVSLLDRSPPDVGMVYSGFYKVDASCKRVITEVIPEKRGYVHVELCADNLIGTCSTVLIRKTCFATTNLFDENLAAGADWDMWLRISEQFEIDYVREPLVLYRVHANRISTNDQLLIQGIEAQLAKYEPFYRKNKKIYCRRYLSLGVKYCYQGNLVKGRQAFLKAIRLYPIEVRSYYNLCLSFLGSYNFTKVKQFRDQLTLRRTRG